jgi:putative membrane-bound dehydrogenase-like protein
MSRSCVCFAVALFLSIRCAGFVAADAKPGTTKTGPLSPREELATFHVPKGFRVELVACEPDIVDPVAMAFDEEGRLYVAEMRGYPNAGVATGSIHSGKIKRLEDRDGDGFYEHCVTYAEGLRFPTSVMPYKGGLLVAVAPDIIYLEDRDGDGKSDHQRRFYTGFGLDNIQQLINGLQWGLDNWVYGCSGLNPSPVRSVEMPEQPVVTLRGRGVRFHPEQPGSLEPTSCGGQFGLAADDWQHWFTNTNSQHLRQIVLPDHYFRRNPALAVSAVTLDIPDHGAACKVFRLSPFEGWRAERTQRRAAGPDARRFPATELVPGGYITSACSPIVYTADLFSKEFYNNTFICDPANNLIHRDRLVPQGATFIAERADANGEFLASTDNWFRPVNLMLGPDGALYVVDFYREVIETPLSLPEDIKKKLNLESRGRGRIWRVVPESAPRRSRPRLRDATAAKLRRLLNDPNSWWRLTAQRLLVERQDKSQIGPMRSDVSDLGEVIPQGRAHTLWTLEGLNALTVREILDALRDPEPGVRQQALRLAEKHLAASMELREAVTTLTNDPSPQVRFQLAFTLGQAHSPELARALARLARTDCADPWMQTALLSSCGSTAPAVLKQLVERAEFTTQAAPAHLQFLTRVAELVGARSSDEAVADALQLLGLHGTEQQNWQVNLLAGLVQGLRISGRSLTRLWQEPHGSLRAALARTHPFFARAAEKARDARQPLSERIAAVRLLGYGPVHIAAPALRETILPQSASEQQLAGIRALSLQDDPQVAQVLLDSWSSYSPGVRREVLEALFARSERLPALLQAIAGKKVLLGQLEPFRIEQLRKLADPKLRAQALTLLASQVATDRQKIVDSYREALALKADPGRGKLVFKKNCATCHRLENEGTEVGPDLLSALRNKTSETLLVDIFDPGREVDPRYINYVVTSKNGRTFTGLIAAETASSLTLRRAEKAEDTILRSQIDEVQATAKSLMPENLETQLGKQEVADLLAYLQLIAVPK